MPDVACAVCGRRTALAPGAALACPSCGAPISAPVASSSSDSFDDSATRPSIPPIPPAVAESPATRVTSAVQPVSEETANRTAPVAAAVGGPADAEDDARTMRAHDAGDAYDAGVDTSMTRDAEVTADFPMAPPPARTQTVPAAALPSTEPSAPARPPRKRGPLALISIFLLILLLLAIVTAGILLANGRLTLFAATPTATIAPTATLAPTATPVSSLNIFTDADHVFQIGYPKGWLVSAKNDPGAHPRLAIFSNPPAQANFNVGTLPTTDTPEQGIVEQALSVLAQKTGIAHRSGPTTVMVGGETWTQEAGDVTVIQNGKPTAMHAIALATIHGAHTIYILELAPVDSFATSQQDFDQMLQSFEFLS